MCAQIGVLICTSFAFNKQTNLNAHCRNGYCDPPSHFHALDIAALLGVTGEGIKNCIQIVLIDVHICKYTYTFFYIKNVPGSCRHGRRCQIDPAWLGTLRRSPDPTLMGTSRVCAEPPTSARRLTHINTTGCGRAPASNSANTIRYDFDAMPDTIWHDTQHRDLATRSSTIRHASTRVRLARQGAGFMAQDP